MVVPDWPSQPWYSKLVRMLKQIPILVLAREDFTDHVGQSCSKTQIPSLVSAMKDLLIISVREDLLILSAREDLLIMSVREDLLIMSAREDLLIMSAREDLLIMSARGVCFVLLVA